MACLPSSPTGKRASVLTILAAITAAIVVAVLSTTPSQASLRPNSGQKASHTIGSGVVATVRTSISAILASQSTQKPTKPAVLPPVPAVVALTAPVTPPPVPVAAPAPAPAPVVTAVPAQPIPSVTALAAQVVASGIDPGPAWTWTFSPTSTCGVLPGNNSATGCTTGFKDGSANTVFWGTPPLTLVAHELANAEVEIYAMAPLIAMVTRAEAGTSWSPIDAVAGCLVVHYMNIPDTSAGTWTCPPALGDIVAANIHNAAFTG
jgi:hypothetical protein